MKFCLGEFFFPPTESLDVISFRAFSDTSCVLLTQACLLRIPKNPKITPGWVRSWRARPATTSSRKPLRPGCSAGPLPGSVPGLRLISAPRSCLLLYFYPSPPFGPWHTTDFPDCVYLFNEPAMSQHRAKLSANTNSSSYGDDNRLQVDSHRCLPLPGPFLWKCGGKSSLSFKVLSPPQCPFGNHGNHAPR